MSGPTAAQTSLQQSQADFYAQATQHASETYGEDQALLGQLTSVYEPILAKGPNQQGFSAAETENLNAGAVEGTAQAYSGASKAVNEKLAGAGGGSVALPSGASAQLNAELAASSADTESKEESQIQQADYATGRQNFQQATGALEDVSGQLNPVAYEGAATNAGVAEGTTANQIAQEENSWEGPVLGAVGSIAGAYAGSDAGSTAISNIFK
jgi:hypothetical protein